jgi:large subunit ribosomal protein L22
MKSIARNVRISPKKIQVEASIVRNMDVKKALDTLRYMPTKSAKLLYKVIESAVANAVHNDQQESSALKLASVVINKGTDYKRHNPISRGRAHAILKRTSHISVELTTR